MELMDTCLDRLLRKHRQGLPEEIICKMTVSVSVHLRTGLMGWVCLVCADSEGSLVPQREALCHTQRYVSHMHKACTSARVCNVLRCEAFKLPAG